MMYPKKQPETGRCFMKGIDVLAAVLLAVGGLNWGLVGLFDFNLVGAVFGDMSAMSRIVYALVGLCAIYQGFQWKSIQQRWARKPVTA
jgi:uncharacterized membrane protein YuzA (DUF378 family)